MFSYKNIGDKIKGLAVVVSGSGTIISIMYGFAIIADNKNMILSGISVIVLGSIIAWVGSCLVYGFGELVKNSHIIAVNSSIIAENSNIIVESGDGYTANYEQEDA